MVSKDRARELRRSSSQDGVTLAQQRAEAESAAATRRLNAQVYDLDEILIRERAAAERARALALANGPRPRVTIVGMV